MKTNTNRFILFYSLLKTLYKQGKSIVALCLIVIYSSTYAQTATQTVKGKVYDKISHEPLSGANILLTNSDPALGTITDIEGNFNLENVPVGRQNVKVSMIGYESYFINELLISSGKQVALNIELEEKATELDVVYIPFKPIKNKPINAMATLSSRQFTVEETQRYAGGLNDPARLVSSFAGVASPALNSNGISIRGNSPSGLLWRIEDVEVPSPNHFANLLISGAGLFTALSSEVMGNSDFYTGAFPAEYGNATSGVFDIRLRTGNPSKRESSFEVGLLGINFATEGPFKKGKDASYLFNYRYSTMALISPILPDNSGILKYQDLSFKINLPTKNAGTFSLWGIGAYDGIDTDPLDSDEWESISDKENSRTSLYMYATGINHKVTLWSNALLNTAIAVSGNGLDHNEMRLDDNLELQPKSSAYNNDYRFTLQSSITQYLGDRHSNRTGFYINHLGYNLDVKQTDFTENLPTNVVNENGQSELYQFYSQSKFKLSKQLTLNAGFHMLYFDLLKEFSVEPRIALNYQFNEKHNIALAYGLHSKIESLPIYFIKDEGIPMNKDLKLMKSNHFVFSYNTMLSDNLKISIEPYFQLLNNVPVSPDSYITTLNTQENLFFNDALVSTGTGRNLGIDFTFERYLNKGLYYMLTASVFDSKYKGNDDIERSTRFNKNYVFNAIIGKEWQIGIEKNNLLSTNFRLNYLGGNRVESIDMQNSMTQQDIIYGETDGELSYAKKHPGTPIISFTISYRKNKPKHSSIWALQVLNTSRTKEFETDFYNINTHLIEQKYSRIMIPNLSYKIEF